MNLNFNEYPWHDATLLSLYIDRRSPGKADIVELLIQWPHVDESSTIRFFECYGLALTMNFGIIASESILTASCVKDSPELIILRKKWRLIQLDNLEHYIIETNSTGGLINIFSKGFQCD